MALNNVDFWIRTNDLIRATGNTQDSLSLKCGFSQRRIENLSVSKRLPNVFEAYLMAKNLNTTVEFLVTGERSTEAVQLEDFQNKLTDLIQAYKTT